MQLKQRVKLAVGRIKQWTGPATKLQPVGSYADYLKTQRAGYEAKRHTVFARAENITAIAEHATRRNPVRTVLCHGTRNGAEQRFFRDALGGDITVLGTEIGTGAAQYPDTIEWDFHDMKPEWAGAWDLIYSNSWDHAADPQRAFTSWASCLAPKGLLVLEHSEHHTVQHVRDLDPFGASFSGLVAFANETLRPSGRRVIDTFRLPYHLNDQHAVVIG